MSNNDFSVVGFEPCESEPDACERCGEVRPLYFGNRDYWEPRDGDYYCAECLQLLVDSIHDLESGEDLDV